jgi:molybdenum cofactor cytidylyltransferase
MNEHLNLASALNIGQTGLIAITGGGGKTSLMFALAKILPGKVVITTTTRIFAAQMIQAPAVCIYESEGTANLDEEEQAQTSNVKVGEYSELGSMLSRYGSCLVVARIDGAKALGVPIALPGQLLARPDVDFVIVEADGSRMQPIKAPADHEPVINPETNLVVNVVGIDAIGGRLTDIAHRPERVARVTGLELDDRLTGDALEALIVHPDGGMKSVPDKATFISFINKVETESDLAIGRRVAKRILQQPRVSRVVIGALRSDKPVLELHRRVKAVVLAAGESKRMGSAKQLLPWGTTTVLGQTLDNLEQSGVTDIVVVSGHARETIETVADRLGVASIYNPRYADGEMLSSLQAAVSRFPDNIEAILVMLADQPMVRAQTIDQLLVAYWRCKGELIAPMFKGERGNPVLIGRKFFPELLALPQGSAPRDLVRRHQDKLNLVEVDTDSVLQDLDRPEQYERLRPKD